MTRIVLTALTILVCFSASAFSQSDAGCVTEKCHADIASKKWVHGPVGAFICTVCHNEVPGKDHEFQFSLEKEELCFACHETSRDMMLNDHLHTPVANGNCVGCHDPHQSDHKFTLKGAAADLCFVCHDKAMVTKDFVHGPVGVGDCNVCHNPHASANENQLLSSPDQVCFDCHEEQKGKMASRHKHPPAADKCTSCHDAHADNARFLLPKNQPDMCFDCHPEINDHTSMTYQHPPTSDGECKSCHDAHASEFPRLFNQSQQDLCLSCHGDLKDYVSAQNFKHGPVQEGDCNACHDSHGSQFVHILRKYFPPEFYKPYASENYDICFECHNPDMAIDEHTTTLTGFRDGDVNMHYLHVNKDIKGRSCKACHQVHASSQNKHIRKSVPFGEMSWELPVTFTKYEDGGKCVVGCHAPKEYHRK